MSLSSGVNVEYYQKALPSAEIKNGNRATVLFPGPQKGQIVDVATGPTNPTASGYRVNPDSVTIDGGSY